MTIDEAGITESFSFAEFIGGVDAGAGESIPDDQIWTLNRNYIIDVGQWAEEKFHASSTTLINHAYLEHVNVIGHREYIVKISNGKWYPHYGAVENNLGILGGRSASEASYYDPMYSFRNSDETISPTLIRRAAVCVPWGAIHNYGHFLFDAIPAFAFFKPYVDAGILQFVCPPLKPWHYSVLELFDIMPEDIHCFTEDSVSFQETYYGSWMDHFLNWTGFQNKIVNGILRRRLDRASVSSAKKVFFTRRDNEKRRCLNLQQVEQTFAEFGFYVVDPLDQEVYSQLSIANNADYIAGFGGAGLANIMGIRSRSKIFEILPPKFSSNWIRNFCATLWVEYFAHGVSEVSLKSADAVINEKLHKDFFTSYEIDIDDLNADLGVFLKDCP